MSSGTRTINLLQGNNSDRFWPTCVFHVFPTFSVAFSCAIKMVLKKFENNYPLWNTLSTEKRVGVKRLRDKIGGQKVLCGKI